MNVMTNLRLGVVMSPEERALRRKLLFRLLKDYDFSAKRHGGEMISETVDWGHLQRQA